MQRPPFSPFPGLAAKPYFIPLMVDHAVRALEVELVARDTQQPELGIELHFGDREGELDHLLRKLVGAVPIRAEREIAFFAYAEIAVGVLATQPVVLLDQFAPHALPAKPSAQAKRCASRQVREVTLAPS